MNGDAASKIVGKLDEEGVESEGGRRKASDGIHEALIPIASRAFEKSARKEDFCSIIVISIRGSPNVLA